MTLKSIRSNDGSIHYYTVGDQISDAIAEAAENDKQTGHDVWAYLDRESRRNNKDDELRRIYRDAADEVALMQMWSLDK